MQLSENSTTTFKKALEEYDKKYITLIDYFGIIGPPINQIYGAIEAANQRSSNDH